MILTGFVLITFKKGMQVSLASTFFSGVLIAFMAALIWGGTTVTGKILLNKKISATAMTFFRNLGSSLFCLILAFISLDSVLKPFSLLLLKDWLWLAYLGLIVSGIGLVVYFFALKNLKVKKLSCPWQTEPPRKISPACSAEQNHICPPTKRQNKSATWMTFLFRPVTCCP